MVRDEKCAVPELEEENYEYHRQASAAQEYKNEKKSAVGKKKLVGVSIIKKARDWDAARIKAL